MEIADAMTSQVQTINVLATAEEAAARMALFHVGALPVYSEGRLVGIITDRDILVRCVAEGKSPGKTNLGILMTPNPVTVGPREPVTRAVEIMSALGFRRLPVVDQGHVIGIISVKDLVRRVNDGALLVGLLQALARGADAA